MIVPEGPDTMQSADLIANRFVVSYLHDAHSVVRVFALDGMPERDVELPTIGSVGGISGKRDDREMLFAFTSFTYPTQIYRYHLDRGELSVFRAQCLDRRIPDPVTLTEESAAWEAERNAAGTVTLFCGAGVRDAYSRRAERPV